jgi:cholesterol transport system auxiliary component
MIGADDRRGAWRRMALTMAVSTLLAACAGSLFQSKAAAPMIYLLSADLGAAGAAPSSASAIPADLAVLRPRVRTGLEGDRIAVLYPDRHLDYIAGARWSGPLDEVIQDLAIQAFQTGAALRSATTDASAFPSGYWLELDVADFQAEYSAAAAPTIRVHMTARLGGANDRRVLANFDADALQPAADNRLTAIVNAYEKAVTSALAEIVAGTTRALGEASKHP